MSLIHVVRRSFTQCTNSHVQYIVLIKSIAKKIVTEALQRENGDRNSDQKETDRSTDLESPNLILGIFFCKEIYPIASASRIGVFNID